MTNNQMVSRFRVKKLSPKHSLPVFKENQLPDLQQDFANIQRAVPQIETGVEKEEEEEHDLQVAISAAQAAVTTGAKVQKYIPTPDASRHIAKEEYIVLYKKDFIQPANLIRYSLPVEESIGCPYVLDEKDEAFLIGYNTKHSDEALSEDFFEDIMNGYETITDQYWPHLNLNSDQIVAIDVFMDHVGSDCKLKTLLNNPIIYDYWKKRRYHRGGKSIIPQLKFDEAHKNETDPYMCFRRRETKPVRKTRHSDQRYLERLRSLRTEMEMSRNLLEMVLRREKMRKESLVLEHQVFNKRTKALEYQKTLGIKEDEDLLPKTKKKAMGAATIKIPLYRLNKSPAQLVIEAELTRKKSLDMPFEDITAQSYQPFPLSTPQMFYGSLDGTFGKTKPVVGPRFRKRLGRNGRVYIDRVGFKPLGEVGDKYKYDSDMSDEENDDPMLIDEMESLYLNHRAKLLSESDIRSLKNIPAAAITKTNQHQQINISSPTTPITKTPSSRTKMTPKQTSIAMANGMIVSNIAASLQAAMRKNLNIQQ